MATIRQINAELVKSGKAQNYLFRDHAIAVGVNVDSETESAAYIARQLEHLHSLIAAANTDEELKSLLKEHRANRKWLRMVSPEGMAKFDAAAFAKFPAK